MSEQPRPSTAADSGGDHEYDLAHEVTGAGLRAPSEARGAPTYVSTQTDDAGGDHGYDLAHDVPRLDRT